MIDEDLDQLLRIACAALDALRSYQRGNRPNPDAVEEIADDLQKALDPYMGTL